MTQLVISSLTSIIGLSYQIILPARSVLWLSSTSLQHLVKIFATQKQRKYPENTNIGCNILFNHFESEVKLSPGQRIYLEDRVVNFESFKDLVKKVIK